MMRNFKGTAVAAATLAGVAGVLAFNPSDTPVAPTAAVADASGEDASDEQGSQRSPVAEAPAQTIPNATAQATYSGSVYTTPWGPIQLEAIVEDGRIVDISWISLPSDPHSRRVNDRAAPALVEEALAAQSATVDAISGATYTSTGFRYSLQSILEQAGL